MLDGVLDEYKALREEILALYDRRASVQNTGTALFAGLLTAAFLGRAPELAIAGTALLIGFYRDETKWTYSMARIGAYIHAVIEPEVPGLRWEHAITQSDANRKPGQRGFKLIVSRYPMSIAIGVLLSVVSILLAAPSLPVFRTLLSCALWVVLVALFVWAFRQANRFGEHYEEALLAFSTFINDANCVASESPAA